MPPEGSKKRALPEKDGASEQPRKSGRVSNGTNDETSVGAQEPEYDDHNQEHDSEQENALEQLCQHGYQQLKTKD